MEGLFPFFLVLFVGLFFSTLLSRLHVPWVVVLIMSGVAIGPSGLDMFTPNEVIQFIGNIGLIFLMFMAGLETDLSRAREYTKSILWLSFINGALPFIVGVSIGLFFGYELITALMIGIIFVTSSVAVIIPSLEATNLLTTKIGRTVVATTVFEDVVSLILFSLILQYMSPQTALPLSIFYAVLLLVIVSLRWAIPRITNYIYNTVVRERDIFQNELRSILVVLLGTVVIFELLGLHSVIAAFFVGFVLSGSIRTDLMKEKLKAITYGIFIPIFFVLVGARVDLHVLTENKALLPILGVLILGSFTAKFVSGWVGGRVAGFSSSSSAFIGAATTPNLSTALAGAFAAYELGIFDDLLLTSIILLSLVTTLAGPVIIRLLSQEEMENVRRAAREQIAAETNTTTS